MVELHKLLKRQFKKHLGLTEIPDNLKDFITAIDEAYKQNDDDKLMVERSLELSSKELSEMIAELRRTQVELLQREKMASIGQLAAGIAHEINNPLGYINSNINTLNKYINKYLMALSLYKEMTNIPIYNPTEEYANMITKINSFEKQNKFEYINKDIKELMDESTEGLHRIVKIVQGLKDFSRIDFAQDFVDYELNQGVESTLLIANNSIKYTVKLVLQLSDLPVIKALGGEINQVILNIIINAVHAINSTGKHGTIRIATYENDDSVVLEVEDSGIGIPEESLLKIFDPFYTTKKVGEGTGLGLSIAYDIIVNKHKGKIDVRSEIGKGTTFILQIPKVRD
ncbi:histidine kinase [Clostridium estertheticum]|uniref:Histidine kinase n=1 Tax=Clostridium estertheticum TaxID=238834 RepID=A0AA47I9N3_9CLOT|nr:ATP-binding protein [Clostridium estertheticum]MBU3156884.1 histidine kinase [Clostridium estertheticum]MBU3201640.1 histidine kinase [Clostridium estertheticum]WAG62634.1 histidine kinase [Clostridium estertheticum]WAG67860.1 histidine kinase [Clostridium estertheticum]